MSLIPHFSIDLEAILHNYMCLKQISSKTQIAGVVKDNAYGIGAERVTDILYTKGGCRSFFVAYAFEGAAIRSFAPQANIYVLQGFSPEEAALFSQNNLIPVLASTEQIKQWFQLKPNTQKAALQVETGLNRLGITKKEIAELSDEQRSCFGLIISHLACADDAKAPLNQSQLAHFLALKPFFPQAQFSLSASDGFSLGPSFYFDIVRAGAFLYGINTFPSLREKQKSVVSLTARIIQIKQLKSGDTAGYGGDFKASDGTKIAIVSIGYGDGLPRCFSKKGKVWFKTQKSWISAPVAGRVSMDNLIIDVTHIPEDILKTQNDVSLLNEHYTVDELGTDTGTIGYEALSAIGHGIRALRTYK